MREIKFRAWDKRQKRMIQDVGFHPHIAEAHHLAPDSGYEEGVESYTICPLMETHILMQYTGLLDKNGVEVYEDDTLMTRLNKQTTQVDRVKWIDGCFKCGGYFLSEILHESAVNGNIYEHPETMGAK